MPWNENKGDVDVEDDTPKANGGPWGSGGSTNGNGGSPWNRPGAGGKGSDLEDQVRKMQRWPTIKACMQRVSLQG